jgi:hypothetical protein
MSLALGIHLVRSGHISADQLIDAVEQMLEGRPQLGQIALQEGLLSLSQLFEVLAIQRMEGKAFGEIAVERQFLTRAQLANLLLLQHEQEPNVCDLLCDAGLVSQAELQTRQAEWRMENRKRETIAIGAIRREIAGKPAPHADWENSSSQSMAQATSPPLAAVV